MSNTTRTTARLRHLKRLRWGVFAGVLLGIAVSVATNVLHADDNLISQGIAAWPPLALFGGIELISRIPSSNRWLSIGRIAATLAVAGTAGSISYGQMVGTVAKHGVVGWQGAIWPISVDGLMLVATLSLVEVVAKIRQLETSLEERDIPVVTVAPVAVPVTPAPAIPAQVTPVPVPTPSPVAQLKQVIAQTSASMPVPVSPASVSGDERIPGTKPVARQSKTVSPLTGRVLTDRRPKA